MFQEKNNKVIVLKSNRSEDNLKYLVLKITMILV